MTLRRDIFLSHAWTDKETLARPLYNALRAAGLSVWYDEAEIGWGDSIAGKIQDGLSSSRFVLVLLTPHFVKKSGSWRHEELNAALSLQIGGGMTRVLPLVHNISSDVLLRELPLLGHRPYETIAGESSSQEFAAELARIAEMLSATLRSTTTVTLCTRDEADNIVGTVRERVRDVRSELRILGNDCKYMIESLSQHLEEALERGVSVQVMCVKPGSVGAKTLPYIDPRFPVESDFNDSMSSVEKVLNRLSDTYISSFNFRYLPIAPSFGLFITDPDSADSVLKVELYGAKPFVPTGSRPHLLLGPGLLEWRTFFLQQWNNYWEMGVPLI